MSADCIQLFGVITGYPGLMLNAFLAIRDPRSRRWPVIRAAARWNKQFIADLFQTTKQNIGQHLKNIFSEGELPEDSVVQNFFTTAVDGKKYKTNFYNLDIGILEFLDAQKKIRATKYDS